MEIRPRGAEIIILHLSPITYETQESVMSVTRVALEKPAGNVIHYLTTLPEFLFRVWRCSATSSKRPVMPLMPA